MKVCDTSREGTVKKDPLAVFYEIFGGLIEWLDAIRELGKALEELPESDLDVDARRDLKLAVAKFLIAAGCLERVLGRPPTYAEISEASGVEKHRVRRIAKGEYDRVNRWLKAFYEFSVKTHTELGFKKLLIPKEGENDKVKRILVPKKFGVREVGKGYFKKEGAPLKLVAVRRLDPLRELFEELESEERARLETYLTSPPFLDLYRLCLIEQFKFAKKVLTNFFEPFEKVLDALVIDVVENVLTIARRQGVEVAEEQERLPKELPQGFREALRHIDLFDLIIERLEKASYEELVRDFVSPALHSLQV